MNEDAVFKRYDVRGKYPGELNEEFCRRIGKAVGTFVLRRYNGEVTVCRDNKATSEELKEALIKGILSTGADVYDAGTEPTDYAAFVGNKFGTVSVQVTSSHLPLEFNGLKFMYPEGNGFVNEDLNQLEKLFRQEEFEEENGNRARAEKASKKQYIDGIKSFVSKIPGSFEGKKIVVDTMGGASTEFLPELLEELGAEVIDIADEHPDGPYYDPPNPKPEMLEKSRKRMEEENADLLVANDMDADRLAAYNGEWISGDDLFAVFTQLFDNIEIVGSLDTSKAVEEVAEEMDSTVSYTRVGDPFVMDKALELEAELAGEPNGHYAFPQFSWYNSGILASLILAAGADRLPGILAPVSEYRSARRTALFESRNE
ncbi:MAG: hypothetical protein ABEJ72_10490, partial [Candidatus Aenigmatarchaeota archaeon]